MKQKGLIAVSLFDGISCGQVSFKKAGVKIKECYVSEVCEVAKAITKERHPETKFVGDIRKLMRKDLPESVDIVIGGSPCQDLALCGKMRGLEVTSFKQYMKLKREGYKFEGQSCLFWEFIRIYKLTKAKYFFLENVKMSKKWMHIISVELGVLPIEINSSLVTAQNRQRFYWTNIPNVTVPKDKRIVLGEVIPNALAGHGTRGTWNKVTEDWTIQKSTTRKDFKSNCVVTTNGGTTKIKFVDGSVRQMTIEEAEMLQGLPKGYTKVGKLSNTKRFKAVGNGWTIPVVSHIFKGLK